MMCREASQGPRRRPHRRQSRSRRPRRRQSEVRGDDTGLVGGGRGLGVERRGLRPARLARLAGACGPTHRRAGPPAQRLIAGGGHDSGPVWEWGSEFRPRPHGAALYVYPRSGRGPRPRSAPRPEATAAPRLAERAAAAPPRRRSWAPVGTAKPGRGRSVTEGGGVSRGKGGAGCVSSCVDCRARHLCRAVLITRP